MPQNIVVVSPDTVQINVTPSEVIQVGINTAPVTVVGPQGDTGLSAYEIWLSEGNVGTEEDYLQSLMARVIVDNITIVGDGTVDNPYRIDFGYPVIDDEESNAISVATITVAVLPNSPVYDNGVDGVGATLTASILGTLPAINGRVLSINDLILVRNEVDARFRGVYKVVSLGSSSSYYILERAVESNTTEKLDNQLVVVSYGNSRGASLTQATPNPIIGTSDIFYYVSSDKFASVATTGIYTATNIPFYTTTTRQLSRGTTDFQYLTASNTLKTPNLRVSSIEEQQNKFVVVLPSGLIGTEEFPIDFRVTATDIEWKYFSEATWRNLIPLLTLKGNTGDDGLSAYQVAVNNGFVGPEEEWLQSLQGFNGEDGTDGNDGLSAYEIAVNNGFVGNETAWLLSLNGTDGNDGSDGLQGNDGNDGLSAYQIAVNNGFVGPEEEWLQSLQGFNGEDGIDGNDGSDGLSAYEIAVNNGFSGTEAAWLASLNGTNGTNGITAYQVAVNNGFVGTEEDWLDTLGGYTPIKGVDYFDGLTAYEIAINNGFTGSEADWIVSLKGETGDTGDDGLSAYQIAVNNGFVGSESDWIYSLSGANGSQGGQGIPGNDGNDGLSAYEIAVNNGFVGDESAWLLSLNGTDGADGVDADNTMLSRAVSTSSTLLSTDHRKWIKASGTITIDVGTQADYFQTIIQNVGTGVITINGIGSRAIGTKLETQWTACHVYYDAIDGWTAVGALTV